MISTIDRTILEHSIRKVAISTYDGNDLKYKGPMVQMDWHVLGKEEVYPTEINMAKDILKKLKKEIAVVGEKKCGIEKAVLDSAIMSDVYGPDRKPRQVSIHAANENAVPLPLPRVSGAEIVVRSKKLGTKTATYGATKDEIKYATALIKGGIHNGQIGINSQTGALDVIAERQ